MAATITLDAVAKASTRFPNLETVVTMATWPTPCARDYRDTGAPAEHARNTPTIASMVGGALNPAWVEALMGFPTDWTRTDGPPVAAKRSTNGSRRTSRKASTNDGNG